VSGRTTVCSSTTWARRARYWSASSALPRRGDDADLLEERQGVPDLPGLGDLAVAHAMDGDGVDPNGLAGRRDAVDLPHMLAAAGPPDDDPVAGREDLLDPPVAVDAGLVCRDDLDHALRSLLRWHLGVVQDGVGREQLGCELVLAPVVHLLVEAAYDGLGLC